MKKKLFLSLALLCFLLSSNAQNTTFNNVSIGTDGPAYGVQIKPYFPGYTGGWARFFSVSNENGNQNFISIGTLGDMVNGVTGFNRSYIGRDWNDTYLDFLSNGNIGIGTKNPSEKLSVFGGISKLTLTGIDGAFDNFIKYGYKSDLESGTNYANRWHGIDATITAGNPEDNKLKFRLYAGGSGNEVPVDVMTLLGNGNVGIGEVSPQSKLTLKDGNQVFSFLTNQKLVGVWPPTFEGSTMTIQSSGTSAGNLAFATGNSENMRIITNGNVGIGTTTPDTKLTVNGNIHAKEVKIDLSIPVPDYVFVPDYKLKTLQEVEAYINKNNHLPEIPSAKEFEQNGVLLAEMNMNLLKKVEELTLYAIEQEKKINIKSNEIEGLKKDVEILKKNNEVIKVLAERLAKMEAQIKAK